MKTEKKTIIFCKYYDHHWLPDKITKKQVKNQISKKNCVIVSETGMLLAEDKNSIIFAHEQTYDPTEYQNKKSYDSVTRILKNDIIQLKKFKIQEKMVTI